MNLSLDLSLGSSQSRGNPGLLLSTAFPPGDVLLLTQSDVGVTNSGGLVSGWADSAPSPHAFAATTTQRPTLTAGLPGNPGILFNGTTNGMTSAIALPAPGTTPYRIGIVFRQLTWGPVGNYVFGDSAATPLASALLSFSATTPGLKGFCGNQFTGQSDVPLNTWEATELFLSNSTSDSLRRGSNADTGPVASCGNVAGTSFMIGNAGAFTFPTNIEVLHVVIVKGASAVTMPPAWRAAIAAKYGGAVLV